MSSIIEWLRDPHLFGALPHFRRLESWASWLTFLRAFYGLPMDDDDLERFRRHTGRETPRAGGYPEAVAIVGRQSGKTQVAALVGVFEAAAAMQSKRRGLFVPLVAQDHRAAQRALLGYVREILNSVPMFTQAVARERADGFELGAVTIGTYPCRPSALRGVRAPACVVDELAFFTATDGRPTDTEMLRAVRPTLATTRGRLLILSSPYSQAGALFDLHKRHWARDDSACLIWQASAPDMNPTLPADYLERMAQDDPEAYRSEVLGEFRTGTGALFDADALDAVVEPDVRERPAMSGTGYVGFVDPSGGRRDAFTVAIAHRDPTTGDAVLDCLRAWVPPFSPASVIREAATLLRRYSISKVEGDRFGAEFNAEHFRAQGVTYEPSERDRSAIYLELLPLVNAASVRLLDLPELLRELRGLERRRGTAGRDRVDHRPGAHDDRANAAAGALVLAAARRAGVTSADMTDALAFNEEVISASREVVEALDFGGDPYGSVRGMHL